jgi:hypothetical protein
MKMRRLGINHLRLFSGELAISNAKQQVESLLHKLPKNCSLEDIQYHLSVLDKVRRGLDDVRQHGTLSQEDVESG